jgi:hypothetical protein
MGLDTGANRSENVAALASRAAVSEDEISVLNPTEATAIKMAPKIRDRIPSSLMGLTNENSRTPLFQEGFAISGKRVSFTAECWTLGWRGGASVPRLQTNERHQTRKAARRCCLEPISGAVDAVLTADGASIGWSIAFERFATRVASIKKLLPGTCRVDPARAGFSVELPSFGGQPQIGQNCPF